MKSFNSAAALAAISGTLVLACPVHAQWTVTNLHPAGATYSEALASSGGHQAGLVQMGGVYRASLWSGTAASWVDLHPQGAQGSFASGISESGQQAGWVEVGVVRRASLWSGTAASWVDLHPAGATTSAAYDASGGQQGGLPPWAGCNARACGAGPRPHGSICTRPARRRRPRLAFEAGSSRGMRPLAGCTTRACGAGPPPRGSI